MGKINALEVEVYDDVKLGTAICDIYDHYNSKINPMAWSVFTKMLRIEPKEIVDDVFLWLYENCRYAPKGPDFKEAIAIAWTKYELIYCDKCENGKNYTITENNKCKVTTCACVKWRAENE